MKRWLIILLLTVAAAVAHASSGGVFDSTPPSKPEMPSTAILSAGSDHAEQLNTPLAAAVASPGTSRLAGEESTPGKAKIRHGGGVPIPVSAYAASSFQIQRYNQPVRHYESVPFTRSADYYIYTLRRIII